MGTFALTHTHTHPHTHKISNNTHNTQQHTHTHKNTQQQHTHTHTHTQISNNTHTHIHKYPTTHTHTHTISNNTHAIPNTHCSLSHFPPLSPITSFSSLSHAAVLKTRKRKQRLFTSSSLSNRLRARVGDVTYNSLKLIDHMISCGSCDLVRGHV